METVIQWILQYKYAGIFSLLMLGIVGIPLPDESLLAFSGYLIYKGNLAFIPTITAAFLGSAFGITLSYILGRTFGIYLIKKYGYIARFNENKVNKVHAWYERFGRWALIIGYYIPGIRHLNAFMAGLSKLKLSIFMPFAYTGGLIWTLIFIYLGYFLGEEWTRIVPQFHNIFIISAVFIIILFLLYIPWKLSRRKN